MLASARQLSLAPVALLQKTAIFKKCTCMHLLTKESLQQMQRQLCQFCQERGIAVTAYASLGCGELLQHPTVRAVAANAQADAVQLLLLWALQKGLCVVPKSSQPNRVATLAPGALACANASICMRSLGMLEAVPQAAKLCWTPDAVM